MKKKLLYIIKGEHTDILLDETTEKEALACYNIQVKLIRKIVIKDSCVSFFSDGVSEDDANFFNSLLEKIVGASDSERDKIFNKLEEAGGELGSYSDTIDQIEKFAELWQNNIRIRYKRTVDESDPLDVLREKVSNEEYKLAVRHIHSGGDPLILYNYDKFAQVLGKYDDTNIFKNVCDLAEDVNILFIGWRHKLEDFKRKQHKFEIYQIAIKYDNGVKISGNIPVHYKPYINFLTQEYKLINKVKYT